MWNKYLFLWMMMSSAALHGQYADSWINYAQDYYKITVVADGLYRLTAQELSSAGVPVNTIAANRYQLFRLGKEVAIRVVDSNNDSRMDYLEFYGEKSDGTTDTELYVSPDAQPHTYYNLHSDSAAYFLTWQLTNTTGKRMNLSTNLDASGLTPEPYHIASELVLETNSYDVGAYYGSTNEILNPEYDIGEGWTGNAFSGNKTVALELSDLAQEGSDPRLEIVLVGANNTTIQLATVSVGPNAQNLRELGTVSFSRQGIGRFQRTFLKSDVASDGSLIVVVTVSSGRMSMSSLRVDYPQRLNFTLPSQIYHFVNSGAAKGYAVIPTGISPSLNVLEVTDAQHPIRYARSTLADRLEFVFNDMTVSRNFLVYRDPLSVADLRSVQFDQLPFANSDYLIISHPAMNEETAGARPVDAYVQYRESAAGGSHEVIKVEIQQVYDQFGYGQPGPLAVRQMIAKAVGTGPMAYLFLIGKGTTLNYNYYRQPNATLPHYVPTFGYPGADWLYSVNVNGDNATPALATGRLSAINSAQVKAYLDKVKEMEALPFNELWRKDLIHLSGGITKAEQQSYLNFVNNFRAIARGDFLGGQVDTREKQSTSAVQEINVANKVNEGVSQITFFGHSSSLVSDIEIGRPSDPAYGYTNKGRYPMILVNGCNAGGIFTTSSQVTWGEDWLRTPNAGSIGFIANSDYAQSSSLKRWTDLYYLFAFANDSIFGSGVGEIMNHVSDRYLSIYGQSPFTYSQLYQTVLQGDPAIPVFGARQPDYHIEGSETFASAFGRDRVVANLDSFAVNLLIRNYGKTSLDSLEISISRRLPDGTETSLTRSFERVLRQDTLSFTLYNQDTEMVEGTNVLTITVDPENKINEISESNNVTTFELFIPRGNTIPLYPINYGVVTENENTLIWQSANQLERDRTYLLEVDTTRQFESPFRFREQIQGDLLVSYPLDLSALPDSTTIYWRTRFANPTGLEDTTWVLSSFSKIRNGSDGWAQLHYGQFQENALNGVAYDAVSRKLQFLETSTDIQLNTHGPSSGKVYEDYQVIVDGANLLLTENLVDPDCKRKNAINAVVFSKQTAQPYRPFADTGRDIFIDIICGTAPQRIFNFNENDVIQGDRLLDSLISTMSDGDMVLLFSFGTVNYSKWDRQLKESLASVGIQQSTIDGLEDGQPVIFLGKKGEPEGSAIEVTRSGVGPLPEQSLRLESEVTGKFSTGNLTTPRLGPASSWRNFDYQVNSEPGDITAYSIIGVNEAGQETTLFQNNRTTEIDLSSVDASQHPYLYINFAFGDEQNLTPPTLNGWVVEYAYPPEGLLHLPNQSTVKLDEGEDFSREYAFTNLSQTDFSDSLDVEVLFTTVESEGRERQNFKIAAPLAGDTSRFSVGTRTRGKQGDNNLLVTVKSQDLEQYTSNNSINQPTALTVQPDQTNPVLDVTFDGGYIMDGDIVSPTPTILVKLKDDNPYLTKDDTTGFIMEMKAPCETCTYQRILFTNPEVSYQLATETEPFQVTYQPAQLEDGVYHLRVQASDETGNFSGTEPYEISFEVVNESAVTHFYPYPNPFSTQTRFVFTLTGSSIPDRIKIQIMTVSGRVVREITQDEIGPIRIGNNITQYAWDGRDEFGDLLANGVYLYRVFIETNGQQMKQRFTVADRAFKNGFGKLYILR